ncbi:MAG TPA: hypothetical protein VI792_08600 [Candidatus Eisenbacteria bacterium]
MRADTGWRPRARACGTILLLLGAIGAGGCFDAPKLEDRWTRVDVLSSNVAANQALAPGSTQTFQLGTTVTYRAIVTGYAVAELRASSSVPLSSVDVNPNAPRLRMAQDIDRILLGSVSMGRAIRPVTGWDHLIQHIDFSFAAPVPAAGDSSMSPGGGLYLLCYLGSGVKIELPSGADSIAITPFNSQAAQVLPVGMGFTP